MQPSDRAKPDWMLRAELIAIGVVAVSVILAILALAPVQHSYSEQFGSSYPNPGVATLTVPKGSDVTGSWSTNDSGTVEFAILDAGQTLVYSSDAHNGTYTFTASDPPYTLGAISYVSETVYVWGTYSAPIL